MAEKKHFNFFSPPSTQGGSIAPNFPLGGAAVDFTHIKKNIPHFAELAGQFGLQKLNQTILKNTMQFATVKQPANTSDSVLPVLGNSSLGFPIFSNLIIRAGNYQNNQGVTIGEYPDIRIDTVIMEVQKESNRIVTDIQGRDRSVIEYLSRKSKTINIKGRISSNTRGAYPYKGVQDLSYALDSNKSLTVDSWFLQMLGIYSISPGKLRTPQEEGSLEYQLFEFDAIEDAPVILKIKR
jgi:hypothetical protein